ncbi:MAG: hypothetical protein V4519_00885 [Patescibacteria group bacterium]
MSEFGPSPIPPMGGTGDFERKLQEEIKKKKEKEGEEEQENDPASPQPDVEQRIEKLRKEIEESGKGGEWVG